MRLVLQRVSEASVIVGEETVGSIRTGLVILCGIAKSDTKSDVEYLSDKVLGLRIFPDEAGRMNRNVVEADGSLLVVSQFTLYGDCRKGKRPSFSEAAPPEKARTLYELLTAKCRERGITVETGIFREMMKVYSINDGPVTLLLDSRKIF